MASQEEDNKLECISNVNREQEIYCLNVYKKYDTILNNKTESFVTKVKSLIEVWKSIADLNLTDFDIRYVVQIIEWAKLHALNIVLTGEWRSTKEQHCKDLLENIEKAQNKLLNVNNAFSTRCQKLADVVKKPWEDPVLTNMLHTKEAEIGAPEIEFFCVETAYLVSVRLKKLCESQCEDLALNLVTNFLNYTKLATTHNFNINATATQMWFIFDIYMALLYKFQDRQKMVQNFQELQLHEGLQLVKRFAKKRVKISKIWRNCHRIAIYGSRFFLSKTLMKYTDDLKEFLIDLLKTYISLSSTDSLLNEFVTSVRSITNLADAPGLCVMCEVIHREAGDKLRHFIIEMYIRALTTDMNELERLKHVQDTDKVASTTSRLANTFSNLADLLNDHVKVSRECVLTAFSLEPTKERLKRIEQLAEKSGFQVLDTGQEWKCRLHPPMLPSDDIAWMCAECGDWMNKPELSAPVKINMALNEALQGSVLGISDSLCDDLVVCLSNPRYQVLSWLLPWGDLYRLCVMYLSDPEKTKNFVTELKFVDIDYSLFQHIKREPLDEYTGIEKGYEQYLDLDFVSDEENSSISEDSMSQDKSLSLGSDGSGEPYLTPFPQPKSDPNTLKSLRMFRPNLKRKTGESESVPEKQLKTTSDINKPSTSTSSSSYNFSDSSSLSNYLSSSSSRPVLPNTGLVLPNKTLLDNRTATIPLSTTTKEETDSKNVVAATLLQLGGQVAINNNQIIQVPQTPVLSHIPNSHYLEQKASNLDLVQLLQSKTSDSHTKGHRKQLHGSKSTVYSRSTLHLKPTVYSRPTLHSKPTVYSRAALYSKPTVNSYFSDNVDRLLSTAQLLEEMTDYCPEIQPPQKKQHLPPQNNLDQNMRDIFPSISNAHLPHNNPVDQQVIEMSAYLKPVELPELSEPPKIKSLEPLLMESLEPPQISTQLNFCQEQIRNGPLDNQEQQAQEILLLENTRVATICTQQDTPKTITPTIVSDVLPKESDDDCQQNQVDISYQYEDISSASESSNQVDNDNKSCKGDNDGCRKYGDSFTNNSNSSIDAITKDGKSNSCEYCDTTATGVPNFSFVLSKEVEVLPSNSVGQIDHQTSKDIATLENNNTVLDRSDSENQNILNQGCSTSLNMVPKINKAIDLLICDDNKENSDIRSSEDVSNLELNVKYINKNNTSCLKLESTFKGLVDNSENPEVLCNEASDTKSESGRILEHCQISSLEFYKQSNTSNDNVMNDNVKIVCELESGQDDSDFMNGGISSDSNKTHDVEQLVQFSRTKISGEVVHETDHNLNDSSTITKVQDLDFQILESNLDVSKISNTEVNLTLQKDAVSNPNAIESTNCSGSLKPKNETSDDVIDDVINSFSKYELNILEDHRGTETPADNLKPYDARLDNCTSAEEMVNDCVPQSVPLSQLNILHDSKETDSGETNLDERVDDNTSTEELLNESVPQSVAKPDSNMLGDSLEPEKSETMDVEDNDIVNSSTEGLLNEPVSQSDFGAQLKLLKHSLKTETSINVDVKKDTVTCIAEHPTYVVFDEHNYFKKHQLYEKYRGGSEFSMDCLTSERNPMVCQDKQIEKEDDINVYKPLNIAGEEEYTSSLTVDNKTNITYLENLNEIRSVEADVLDLAMENNINIVNTSDLQQEVNCEDILKDDGNFECTLREGIEHYIFSDDYEEDEECIKPTENNVDFSNCENREWFTKVLPYDEFLPKNFISTENIRTYCNTHRNRHLNVPCFKKDYDLSLTKNVNSNDKTCTICGGKHYNLKSNNFNLKELKVLLCRLPSNVTCTVHSHENRVKNSFSKKHNIFERLKSPTRRCKKKRRDKSDIYNNYFKRPSRRVRHRRVAPLLDVNLRHSTRRRFPKKRLYNCDYKSKFKNRKSKVTASNIESLTEKECKLILEKIANTNTKVELQRLPIDVKECKKILENLVSSYPLVELDRLPLGIKDCKVILENIMSKNKTRLPLNNKYFTKQILKNVPGLNDYELLRPRNVNQIVNVVQIAGGRPTSNVTSQNTQTSTPVSPHIQRIGQPRVVEPKPEIPITLSITTSAPQNSSIISTSSTVAKPATTQPSTLINILSQQIIRPNPNTVRNRNTPFINILSQQIIRPGTSLATQKTMSNSVPSTANSTVLTTENHQNIIIKSDPSFTLKSEPTFTLKSEPTFTIKSEPTFTIKSEPTFTIKSDSASEVSSQTEVKTIPIEPPKILNSSIKSLTTPTATTSNPGGTILQFICKKTLPKFQQAFGKTVYQPSSETHIQPSANIVETTSSTSGNVDTKKVVPSKTIPVNMQPLQGNVIYRGQMPVGQTISLIPPGSTTRQLFRITGSSHEQISLVKETVIQNKMSALLAAALQGKPKVSEQNGEVVEEYSATRITLCRPNAVQGTRLVKPVQLQIPTNVIRTSPQPNLSSTTLEQLREFDMVYKQVKERSSSSVQPEVATSNVQLQTDNQESPQQRISFTYVNQVQKYTQLSPVVVVSSYNNLQPAASPALSVTSQGSSSPCVTPASTPTLPKIASKTSKGKSLKTATTTTNSAIKAAPNIPKPQQKPQEDEHTTQRIFDILAEYAEQLRNSPDLNNKPAPRRRSNPPTNPSSNSKRKKSSSSKKSGQSNSSLEIDTEDLTMGSEDSSGGNIVQLSVTDDEQSQATSITPPESNSENSPAGTRQVILTDSNNPAPQNVIIADTSVGEALKMPNTALIVPGSYIMPVSMVKGTQQIAVVSGGSKILATVPARSGQNMLLFQSFLNQNKKGAISAVKYSAIQPVAGISSQSLAGVSAQPPVILPSSSVATAMALGQPITLKKLDEADRLNTELLLTISKPRENIVKIEDSPETPQPDSSTSLSSDSIDIKEENTSHSDSSSNEKTFNTFQKMNSVATSVIASCIKEESIDDNASVNIISVSGSTSENKEGDQIKPTERMQSVLVNASNGPMLSHTTPRFRKQNEPATTTVTANKEQFLHNGEKRNQTEQKSYKPNTPTYYAGRIKKNPTNKKIDSEMQKQAAMERELRLQKSLSEECEDLGVDEPSTSDLFPEADLLFDSNHSPSYDQTSQDGKRPLQNPEIKEAKSGMNLFSDDESSGPLRNDIFDYVSSEYHAVETALNYQARQLMNGNNTSNESASSCEDSTLLPNCGTMSEVTLNSPISPETYSDATQPTLNKYKYKYTNRKKGERNKQTDQQPVVEVSSSEDAEAAKNSKEKEKTKSPNPCHPHISFEEELSDENFKVVRVAISKTEGKEEVRCQLHCDEDSKKSSRKSTKKSCSCCTGPKGSGASSIRKRPQVSRPQTPVAPQHKKTFLSKKR